MSRHYPGRVSPFGNLRIKACLAAPRSLSQLTTSFIASWHQGIHRLPLLAWPQTFSQEHAEHLVLSTSKLSKNKIDDQLLAASVIFGSGQGRFRIRTGVCRWEATAGFRLALVNPQRRCRRSFAACPPLAFSRCRDESGGGERI